MIFEEVVLCRFEETLYSKDLLDDVYAIFLFLGCLYDFLERCRSFFQCDEGFLLVFVMHDF